MWEGARLHLFPSFFFFLPRIGRFVGNRAVVQCLDASHRRWVGGWDSLNAASYHRFAVSIQEKAGCMGCLRFVAFALEKLIRVGDGLVFAVGQIDASFILIGILHKVVHPGPSQGKLYPKFFLSGINLEPRASKAPFTKIKVCMMNQEIPRSYC